MICFPAQLAILVRGKALKCMRWMRLLIAALGCALGVGVAMSQSAVSTLVGKTYSGDLDVSAHYWHERPAAAAIDQVADAASASRFARLADERMFDLKPEDRLWIRLDLVRSSSGADHLILWIPLPLLDSVKLYQRGPGGQWKYLTAGDRVAVASWPEPGRYPRFHVDVPVGKSSIYLQVQGSTPVSVPIHVGLEQQAQAHDRQGFLGMGLVVGVLLTLVMMCMVTSFTYKDQLYLLYGLYMLVMILAVGAYTGLSAYLIWDESPVWADAAQGVLALLSVGGALYFIDILLGGRQFAKRLSVLLYFLALVSLPLAVLYYFAPRSVGVIILGCYVIIGAAVALRLAFRAWFSGDMVGKWVCIAYIPLAMAVFTALARAYGLISASWIVQYGVVLALLIEAPMMMVALHVRSRDRHEIKTREHAMATHDALTGLLKEHLFDYRLNQAVKRCVQRGEDAAVVLIALVNHEAIGQAYGSTIAEQSVLRTVIKLRKVLGNIDTLARVGTSQFGLILEGATSRDRITEMGARIVAQGLMPLPGLVPSVTLQFHLVAVRLSELPHEGVDIKAELSRLMMSMSRRTRRPIRFLEGVALQPNAAEGAGRHAKQGDTLVKGRSSEPADRAGEAIEPSPPDSHWDSSGDSKDSTLPAPNTLQMSDTQPQELRN